MNTPAHPARLRPATPADARDIEALERASFHWAPEDAFDRRQILNLLHNPRAIVLAATRQKKVIAWCAGLIRRHPRHRSGRIYAIAVHPDAQGLRLGRRLMEKMLAALKSRHVARVFLEVDENNPAAIALYKKLGFLQDRRTPHYYGVGRHALHFRLEIQPAAMTKIRHAPT